MSQEITASVSLTVAKNGLSSSISKSKVFDLSGNEVAAGAGRVATTTPALIDFGGIDQGQLMVLKNDDITNNLVVGLNTPITQIIATIPPGGFIMLQGFSLTMYAASSASTVEYSLVAVEN